MKTKLISIRTFVAFLIIIFALASCTNSKYAAVECPDLPLNSPVKKKAKLNSQKNKRLFASNTTKRNRSISKKNKSKTSHPQIATTAIEFAESPKIDDNPVVIHEKIEVSQNSVAFSEIETDTHSNIDVIESKSITDEETFVEMEESSPLSYSVKGPRIDNYGFVSAPYNSKISSLQQMDYVPIDGLGLAGFLSGIVGLFILGIPLGIVAITFGAISLSKIKKYPDRFRGKGFAVAGVVLGIIDILGIFILLLIL